MKLPLKPPAARNGASPRTEHNRATKIQSAFRACRSQVPAPGSLAQRGRHGQPRHLSKAQRHRARKAAAKAKKAAAQQMKRIQRFRACMGRHGFGPEAHGRPKPGDVGKAFADCRTDLRH